MRVKEWIIKFDSAIKITLLFFHFAGFSVWIGTMAVNQISITAITVTILSGIFLIIREILKEGLIWCVSVEGLLTIVKVLILTIAFIFSAKYLSILLLLIFLGILSAHLPKSVKDKKLFNVSEVSE